MITRIGVRGSMEQVLVKEENHGTVYLRTNIVRVDDEENNFHGWQYDEQQMTASEYTAILEAEVERLSGEDLNNKLALTEIYEMIII